jgi:hypothetical protein
VIAVVIQISSRMIRAARSKLTEPRTEQRSPRSRSSPADHATQ